MGCDGLYAAEAAVVVGVGAAGAVVVAAAPGAVDCGDLNKNVSVNVGHGNAKKIRSQRQK